MVPVSPRVCSYVLHLIGYLGRTIGGTIMRLLGYFGCPIGGVINSGLSCISCMAHLYPSFYLSNFMII